MAESKKDTAASRIFQSRWEDEYFFIEFNNKYICLISKESVATLKEYNLKRHYTSCHKSYSSFDSIERKNELKKWKVAWHLNKILFIAPKIFVVKKI